MQLKISNLTIKQLILPKIIIIMKKIFLLIILIPFIACAQVRQKTKRKFVKPKAIPVQVNSIDISGGLKQALNKGIANQVSKLTAIDGFFGNEAVKILMPDELYLAEQTLRSLGLGKLADDGIKSLNRAAEDAVKEATPIFVDAIANIKITDARNILLGNENSATLYLQTATNAALYQKLSPMVQQSLGRVGADVLWASIIKRYNNIPLMADVNPDINDYVTQKALQGVFKMIAIEEKNIRTNLGSRTTTLLQQVFAIQDKK